MNEENYCKETGDDDCIGNNVYNNQKDIFVMGKINK